MTPRTPSAADLAAAEELLGGKFTNAPAEAYCVICKAKVAIHMPRKIEMRNGKPAIVGNCTTCGSHVAKIGYSLPYGAGEAKPFA